MLRRPAAEERRLSRAGGSRRKKLSVALLLWLLSAAASMPEGAKEQPQSTDLLPLSVQIWDRGLAGEGGETAEDNRWTRWLQSRMRGLGVSLTFFPLPRSEEFTRIPLLMAAGKAPDITATYNHSLVATYHREGALHDLKPYIDSYGQKIVEVITDEVLRKAREGDFQYGIPARRIFTGMGNVNIRGDWLDALGLSLPRTPDELYRVLRAFRDEDPGEVGAVLPFAAQNQLIMKFRLGVCFIHDVSERARYANTISFDFNDLTSEGIVDYYRFMNRLYNEGLMDPEYFADEENSANRARSAFVEGRLGVFVANVASTYLAREGNLADRLMNNVPEARILPIDNLEGPDGRVRVPSYDSSGILNFVPLTASYPEAAVKYLNYLCGEGGHTVWYGFRGEHYQMRNGLEVPIDPEYNRRTKDWIAVDIVNLVMIPGYYRSAEHLIVSRQLEHPRHTDLVRASMEKAVAGLRYVLPVDVRSDLEKRETRRIQDLYRQYRVLLVTAPPSEFEGLWDEYTKAMKELRMDEIARTYAAQYDGAR